MMWGRPPGLRGSSRTRLRRAQARPRACDNRRSSRMPKVFPCYSTPDRELVHELAAFLERGAGVEVLLEEGEMQPGGDLIAKVEEGLSADVVLVLLSPEAVPPRWVLERWKSVFWEQAAEVGTALATLLCRDAKFPDLLRRKNFFDLRHNRLTAFRAIKRWLISLSPLPQKAPFAPARQPSFNERDAELETLCTLLADTPGMAVLEGAEAAACAGKTALALEFARRHQEDFDAVFWLTCGSRCAAALAGGLAAQFGVRLDRDLESNLNELRRLCARHRCLLILDDAMPSTAALLAPRGRTSVLTTTRRNDLAAALSAASVPLDGSFPKDPDRLADTIRNLDGPAGRKRSSVSRSGDGSRARRLARRWRTLGALSRARRRRFVWRANRPAGSHSALAGHAARLRLGAGHRLAAGLEAGAARADVGESAGPPGRGVRDAARLVARRRTAGRPPRAGRLRLGADLDPGALGSHARSP